MTDLLIIGVTGGIGCGKSEVLKYLKEAWNAELIQLDEVSRELTLPGGECVEDVISLLGQEVVNEDGSLNRGRMAEIVFADEKLRRQLNAIIHPAVKKKTIGLLKAMREKGSPLAVIEAALLLEDNYDAICSEIWYIYADEATRYRRLVSSRGYSGARIEAVFRSQMKEEEFRARTDYVIDNSGAFSHTREQIDSRMRELTGLKR